MATFTTQQICNLAPNADQLVCKAVFDRCREQQLDLFHAEIELDHARFFIEDELMFLGYGEEDCLDCYDLHVEVANDVEVHASYENTLGSDFTRIWYVFEDRIEEFDLTPRASVPTVDDHWEEINAFLS